MFLRKGLLASPQLYSTDPAVYPSHTLNDCIHICHHTHEGYILFLKRHKNDGQVKPYSLAKGQRLFEGFFIEQSGRNSFG